MIHRVLRVLDWVVDFVFAVKGYDEEAILVFLYEFDASYSVMRRARKIMESGKNRGFTFANPVLKRAIVVVGPTTSGKEFIDSLVHEVHHLAVAIGKSIGYDLESEGPAYISGDAARALAHTICELGCDKCRQSHD